MGASLEVHGASCIRRCNRHDRLRHLHRDRAAGPVRPQRFWTATDEDAWRGAFTAETSAPVLVVGNAYDPSTNYRGAVTASELLPNSALLTVDAFGHTAYGMQRCATSAVDSYLLDLAVPADRTCESEYQPFAGSPILG